MRHFLLLLLLFTSVLAQAQDTGSVSGKLTDKDYNNEPLAFANVLIKGTTKGTTSDFDGLYEISGLDAGTYTVQISFVGYETQEKTITITAGQTTKLNVVMSASAASLDEIVITTTKTRESESALLLEQQNAVEIKESIGADQLAKLGVSNASVATTKISGVSKSSGSGQVYVRGLGDRYLTTTLNGLPVPSDNIDKKNIDLALFPSSFVQNVSISKTFSPLNSADQASGNINILTKDAGSKSFGINFSGGINSNVGDEFNNFKVSPNNADVNLGIYSRRFQVSQLPNAITQQAWDPTTLSTPVNYSFGFHAGGALDNARKLKAYVTGGQSVSNEYQDITFLEFDRGSLRDSIPDGEGWRRTVSTRGMALAEYKINSDHKLKFNTLLVNKVVEETVEGGREGNAIVFEELDTEEDGSQFIRDQNIKNTLLSVTQLIGRHQLSENNTLDWAAGFNYVEANEPNRIRNEINILNDDPRTPENEEDVIELGFTGGFQQRKSAQEISDEEINAKIKDQIILKQNLEGDDIYKVIFGANFRNKKRNFRSQFLGVEEAFTGAINPRSIDEISGIFTQQNFDNGTLSFNVIPQDRYKGDLSSYAGFADFIATFEKFTAEVGLRYQRDEIDVIFNVGNFVNPITGAPRVGTSNQEYNRVYPAVNFKYDFTDKLAVRLAGSTSQTLPEFKEIAPFEYVSPQNQISRGNPDIVASKNLNVDLKFEFFPGDDELLSLTGFYKRIEDPINRAQQTGSAGIFSYFNTGDEATIIGAEVEGRIHLVKTQDSLPSLKLSGNLSYINHKQDLKEVRDTSGNLIRTFRYGGVTETGLEGASDWVSNLSLTYDTGGDYPYVFTLSGNYASDKIFSLGSPRNQSMPEIEFNGEIVERGVVTLDFILNKTFNDHWSASLRAKNLLNPEIRRTQFVRNLVSGEESNRTVLSYTTGVVSTFSINYKF